MNGTPQCLALKRPAGIRDGFQISQCAFELSERKPGLAGLSMSWTG